MGASSAFFGCSLVAWFLSNTLVVALSRHDESEFDVLSHLSTIESYKQSALDLLGTASSLDSQYTSCYVDAVDRYATSGCTQLSEDSMGRLALQLAECHLRESHRKIWSCKNDAALHKCTSRMSAEQFQVFSLFLTHTPGLCSLIRGNMQLLHVQESWTKLLEATMHAADWLKEQNFVSEQLLEVNNRLLSSHARLLDAEQRMSTSLELMETSVHAQKLFFDRQSERLQASVDEARRCAVSFAATFRNVSQVLACVWFAVFAPVWINVCEARRGVLAEIIARRLNVPVTTRPSGHGGQHRKLSIQSHGKP
ncbi:hypothetical protein FVE85_0447 [Porphyridium purpureum]|uniref:Uncharacterized protein n=1 Tax=Porphyridium purpureum TaxID=35688 RepID=A0A5J4Z046_PORPP|nr:hypothetical protein FVE85_0447 [Porphyridium purpureum]|eukprot:POR3761..scf208_2